MKRLVLIIGLISFNISISGQSIEKRYTSHLTEKGTIHFFRPKQLDRTINMDDFSFDMSYLSKSDTVIVNCSLTLPSETLVKGMSLKNGNHEVACYDQRMLYRDVTKKGYILRVTSKFPYSSVKSFFSSASPLMFCFTLADDSRCYATYKESKWKKEQYQVTKIINSIDF
jgi:hypothetical protein